MTDESFAFTVDSQQVRRFAEAAWDDDPRYIPGQPQWDGSVPPTFLGAASTLVGRPHSVPQMGFNVARAFHGTETITVHADIAVGSRLQVVEELQALSPVQGARGGAMRRAMRVCRFVDEAGRHVADTERVILETAEALKAVPPAPQGLQTFDYGLEARPDPVPAWAGAGPPSASFEAVTRTDFVRYALASGDLTAVHFDEYAARAAGFPAPFAMGMFSAALVGHVLTTWTAIASPWRLSVRFRDLVWPGDTLVVSAAPAHLDGVLDLTCRVGDRVVTTASYCPLR